MTAAAELRLLSVELGRAAPAAEAASSWAMSLSTCFCWAFRGGLADKDEAIGIGARIEASRRGEGFGKPHAVGEFEGLGILHGAAHGNNRQVLVGQKLLYGHGISGRIRTIFWEACFL